jgi:hypothetical protein
VRRMLRLAGRAGGEYTRGSSARRNWVAGWDYVAVRYSAYHSRGRPDRPCRRRGDDRLGRGGCVGHDRWFRRRRDPDCRGGPADGLYCGGLDHIGASSPSSHPLHRRSARSDAPHPTNGTVELAQRAKGALVPCRGRRWPPAPLSGFGGRCWLTRLMAETLVLLLLILFKRRTGSSRRR